MKAFTVLFLAHIIGDFYLQPDCLARKKRKSCGWVLIHSAIYAAAIAATMFFLGGGYIFAAAVAAVSHLVIDTIKFLILRGREKKGLTGGERAAFLTDQALHLLVIIACSLWATAFLKPVAARCMTALHRFTGRDPFFFLTVGAMLLAAMKPTNIFVRVMLGSERTEKAEAPDAPSGFKAGRYIGGLERILTTVLLIFGQLGSIALVFTAKSVARFRQLDDKEFAEYYIFGTLLSVVSAFGVFLLLKYLGEWV